MLADSDTPWAARLFEGHDFAFVGNVLEVRFDLPAQIDQGHCLRRASNDEIEFIRQYLSGLIWGDGYGMPHDRYEQQEHVEKVPDEPPEKWPVRFEQLPREKWRYFVVEASASDRYSELDLLCEVAPLTRADLRLSPRWPDLQYAPSALLDADYFGDKGWRDWDPLPLEIGDLDELVSLARQLPGAIARFAPLQHALGMFHRVPVLSDLSVLGQFLVLECLLTHNPVGRADGLSHQIPTKMALLSNRFADPLDYSSFNAPVETVWKKLYRYRSFVAHGDIPDFKDDLQMLGGPRAANTFLRQAARRVLAQAVREPDLIRDLRRC